MNSSMSFRRRMRRFPLILVVALCASLLGTGEPMTSLPSFRATAPLFSGIAHAQEPSETDIQWFRDEMKISDKYLEREEGAWGMSWAHFFTMTLLVAFFIATLVAMYIRSKRTREILRTLMKEE